MYNKLVTKFRTINTKVLSTTRLVCKIQFNLEKQNLEKKIEDVCK